MNWVSINLPKSGTKLRPVKMVGRVKEGLHLIDWRFRALASVTVLATLSAVGVKFKIDHPKHHLAIIRPYLTETYSLFLLLSAFIVFASSKEIQVRLKRIDSRIRAILGATTLAVVVTLVVYVLGYGHNPATFFGSVFASWVSGVAFFALVGAAVALVSLAHPEEGTFDARARILFRRQSGKHIDYIISQIRKEFEHYTESYKVVITVKSYSKNERMFLINSSSETYIRGYIDDIATEYHSSVVIWDVSDPPPGEARGRLNFLRAGGIPHGAKELIGERLECTFDAVIEKGCNCLVEQSADWWQLADETAATKEVAKREKLFYQPKRYTQSLTLVVENHVSGGRPLDLRLSRDNGQSFSPHQVLPGERKTICEMRDIMPKIEAYDLRFLPLTEPG